MASTLAGKGPRSAEPLNPHLSQVPSGQAPRKVNARPRIGDPLFKWITCLFAVLIAALAALIMVEMAINSKLPFEKFGFGFLTRSIWDPVAEQFGALPFIYGTIVSSVISLLIAVPVSLGVAIFLVEKAPRALSNPILFIVQLL